MGREAEVRRSVAQLSYYAPAFAPAPLTDNGTCVTASSTCEGSNLMADNNDGECDACNAKCTMRAISGSNAGSTVNEAKCTACVEGSVLSSGECIHTCPSGTDLSPKDNVTLTTCDPSRSTCSESSTTRLTWPNDQLASGGTEEAQRHGEMEKNQYEPERKGHVSQTSSRASSHRPMTALPELDRQDRVVFLGHGKPARSSAPPTTASPPQAQVVDLTKAQVYTEVWLHIYGWCAEYRCTEA
uniref:TNFR-Cys domain-containing protein n=1 Tax=Mycena chlorophos TaxID=658473 RepID=A0ABQ0M6Z5_MYCCL|nr:predicted protein [Mycena chlorophos]